MSFGIDPAATVALMYDEHTWLLSTNEMTINIVTKKTRLGLTVVVDAPPNVRRFVNQPATNIEWWLRAQGGLTWERIT